MYARNSERQRRALENPVVGGLPDVPGILAAMMISPDLSSALRALANVLLVKPFDGTTMSRSDRELLAAAVSAGNDCFYCMDSHAAFAECLLLADGLDRRSARRLTEDIKVRRLDDLSEKMRELIRLALIVRESGRKLTEHDVLAARGAGAAEQDVHLAVLISSAFCMYNRMVDGLRAPTPSDPSVFEERAQQIADYGYVEKDIKTAPASF